MIIGVVSGFILSEFRIWIIKIRTQIKYKKHFKNYIGEYSVKTKNGNSTTNKKVKIAHKRDKVLEIIVYTKSNDNAVGEIIMNDYTLMNGRCFYHHIDEESKDLSGIYDIVFIEKGVIHARQNYISKKTGKEVNIFYIWNLVT